MRARKIDGNQGTIVDALRQCGATVQILSAVGSGCPDILVGINKRNYLFELKNPEQSKSDQQLTPQEAIWINEWNGQVAVVTTPEEAIAAINPR